MLKIAIIGTGYIGNTHAAACKSSEILELAAIADVNESAGMVSAQKFGCVYYNNAEEMLRKEEIDIVDICLPTFLHEEYVLLAAKYKKHVICEKPITLSLESMDTMIEAVEKAQVKFMVAQVVRFWPEYVKIKEMYKKGKFGEIKMVYGNRLAQHPDWTNWHSNPKKSGGGLFDLHLHDIDFASYIFGKVKSVYAVGWKSATGCWDHVISTLCFENGVHAVIEGAFDMTGGYPFTNNFRVVGEGCSAEYLMHAGFNLENLGSATRSLMYYENGKNPVKMVLEERDPYQDELEYFARCIMENKPLEVINSVASRTVLEVVLAVKESLESGKIVYMENA